MAADPKKIDTPPYCSHATFTNFIKGLRATGIPSRIDKSVLSKMSGSAQAALLSALKWLGLIDLEGAPTPDLEKLVAAGEDQYPAALASVLNARYAFLNDGTLNLAKATGSQVEQKFREYGISGSTVVKCMGFFITAAKEAKIELGPHVKAPKQPVSSNGQKRAPRKATEPPQREDRDEGEPGRDQVPPDRQGFVKIPIPLHGMADGVVYLPNGLTQAQWNYALRITKFLIENYRVDESAEGGAS